MFKPVIVAVVVSVASLSSICRGDWYAAADFMVPTRTVTSENTFQRDITTMPILDDMGMIIGMTPPVVGTENRLALDLDFVAGGRATLGYSPGPYGFEASIMVTDQWDTMSSVSDPGGMLASPFTLIGAMPDPLVDMNTLASVMYRTELESAEISATYLCYSDFGCEAVCQFGVRALAIDEYFEYSSTNAMGDTCLIATTDNRLIGPQLGVRGETTVPGGYLAMSLKGMLAYNEVDRTSDFDAPGMTIDAATTFNTGEAALLGELSIEYLIFPHPNCAVRIGHQFLGITNVGLAPNDPLINNDQSDHVIYHMPYVGIVVFR
jgi:hypothetical protein